MKEILEKYSMKNNASYLKEEEEGIDMSKIEDEARRLQGQIKKFVSMAGALNGNDNFKKALAYLKGAYSKLPHFMALEMVGEGVEVGAEDLTKMNDRETDRVETMAKDMEGNVKVVKESSNNEERYIANASFYVFVTPDESPTDKALELLTLIDENHDGANPRLIGKVKPVVSRGVKYETVKTFTKKDFLNELKKKKKGYQYQKTLDKKAFLNILESKKKD